MTATVDYRVEAGVATVTLRRPQVKNALGSEEWRQLDAHFATAEADATVRVLVVAGEGGSFSAGGDLKTMPERLALSVDERRAQLLSDGAAIRRLRAFEKPVVAKIDGACVGAGLSLALACDVRLASNRARLGATFVKVGLTGDFGLLYALPRIVGQSRAFDLLLSGDILTAADALAIGLVSRVFADDRFEEEVARYVRNLADGALVALALTKEGIRRSVGENDFEAMLKWEAEAQAALSQTADAKEGVTAFLSRRKPIFTGR